MYVRAIDFIKPKMLMLQQTFRNDIRKGDEIYLATINKDMIIGDVINENPDLIQTFFQHGMMCIGWLLRASQQARQLQFTESTPISW